MLLLLAEKMRSRSPATVSHADPMGSLVMEVLGKTLNTWEVYSVVSRLPLVAMYCKVCATTRQVCSVLAGLCNDSAGLCSVLAGSSPSPSIPAAMALIPAPT